MATSIASVATTVKAATWCNEAMSADMYVLILDSGGRRSCADLPSVDFIRGHPINRTSTPAAAPIKKYCPPTRSNTGLRGSSACSALS